MKPSESGIEPRAYDLRITRVRNGWIVSQYDMPNATAITHVARTPKELAELLHEWALQQIDLPSTP